MRTGHLTGKAVDRSGLLGLVKSIGLTCTLGEIGFHNTQATFCSRGQEGRKEMFYLMMHSTHFIYSYMASDIW